MSTLDNAIARDRYTASLLAPTQSEGKSINDCREVLRRIASHFGDAESHHLLERFGCASFKDMLRTGKERWKTQFDTFCKLGEACLNYGVPPSAAWGVNEACEYVPRPII